MVVVRAIILGIPTYIPLDDIFGVTKSTGNLFFSKPWNSTNP
jgi:hypothetical protein